MATPEMDALRRNPSRHRPEVESSSSCPKADGSDTVMRWFTVDHCVFIKETETWNEFLCLKSQLGHVTFYVYKISVCQLRCRLSACFISIFETTPVCNTNTGMKWKYWQKRRCACNCCSLGCDVIDSQVVLTFIRDFFPDLFPFRKAVSCRSHKTVIFCGMRL
jgi:hypothetical protein